MVDKIVKWFSGILTFLLVFLLVGITVLALCNVVGRYILKHTIFWVEEVSALSMGWMVAFGAALMWVRHNHIVMDALDYMLSDKMKYIWDIGVNIIGMAVSLIFFFAGIKALKMNTGYSISLLGYDESIRYLFVPVMGALLFIGTVLTLIQDICNHGRKEARDGN